MNQTKTMPETAYYCKDCNRQVLNDQALRTFSVHDRVLCVECENIVLNKKLGINQNGNGKEDATASEPAIPDKKEDTEPPLNKKEDAAALPTNETEQKADITQIPPKKEDATAPKQKNKDAAVDEKSKTPILDCIKDIVGNDLCQIFGDTGEGKSKFVHAVAVEAINAGLNVFYLDTERNLGAHDIEMLGANYQYTPKFSEMQRIVDNLGSFDLVIIDSVGLPVLNMYAKMKMNEQGKALLNLIGMMGDLKVWTYDHKAIVIVTNQPESEFNKEKGYERRPFGDKSLFNVKEVWKIRRDNKNGKTTKCTIASFRSRDLMKGTKIATMEITDTGVDIMMRGMKL